MNITIDLKGLKTKDEVIRKFSETFVIHASNWDAFEDGLQNADADNPKITFPLWLSIYNYRDFEKSEPDNYKMFSEILKESQKSYLGKNKFFSFRCSETVNPNLDISKVQFSRISLPFQADPNTASPSVKVRDHDVVLSFDAWKLDSTDDIGNTIFSFLF